ncbi:glycoside hydrolase family 76 protein [Thermodesulfobacteriota bacterium]
MIPNHTLSDAAVRLYQYIMQKHWNGQALVGPDPGVRFNSRIGRFIKSYLSFISWSDNIAYIQGQKYWILNNWSMMDMGLVDVKLCREVAVSCTDYLVTVQKPEGYWEHPNPEWADRIATVEGNYGAMGLLETYLRTEDEKFLKGAIQWYRFMIEHIGFQNRDGFWAINYFKDRGTMMIPNISVSALRMCAMLAKATDDDRYLEYSERLVAWLNHVQMVTGELPYGVNSVNGKSRIHFLCYQYNAFEFLNLADYYQMTGDRNIWPVLEKLAGYVAESITETDGCRYDCQREKPEVLYYGMAAGAALRRATELDIGNYGSLADRACKRILSQQREDGGIAFYSQGNYGFLTDRRSYPRYLSMILYHMLLTLSLSESHTSK